MSDIVVVGGGLNGPALALACAHSGFKVALVDAQTRAARESGDFDGRGYALSVSSHRLLQAIHVWPDIQAHTQPILDVKVTDGKAGDGPAPFMIEFDHTETGDGPMGHMVEDRHLRRAFLKALDAHPNITQVEGRVAAQAITAHGADVTLEDGRTITGKMLAGCDGRSSGTAQRAGISRTSWSYKQTALVCAIEHEAPHKGCAHQFFMPAGPLAILPLPNNRSSIVWTENSDVAQDINSLSDAEYLDVLRPRFGDFLGNISLAGARHTYPLGLTLANAMIKPRLALVGDAAHGVHPISGQGLNAGLKDVAALAEVLTNAHRRGEDIGREDVLARYQQWRRFDVATLALMTDGFNRLFSNDNPLLRFGRDIGMGALNAFPSLRRSAMREAAGISGDLPKLLQGRAL
jgi:2-octaprenyl-6-methoxyphenol hydroxylase